MSTQVLRGAKRKKASTFNRKWMVTAQFSGFLRDLGVETIATDMSFGVATIDGELEWASHSFMSFIGHLSRLLLPSTWRLLFDIVRFSLFATDVLQEEDPSPRQSAWGRSRTSRETRPDATISPDEISSNLEPIGEYLKAQKYSEQFISFFLIPMVAAPWCINPDEFARTFPAKSLIKFM